MTRVLSFCILFALLIPQISYAFDYDSEYGALVYVKSSALNKSKDTLFDRFIPGGKIDFQVDDDKFSGIKLSNMNGEVILQKEDILMSERDGKMIIDVKKARILLNVRFSVAFIRKTVDISAEIAFYIEMEFGKNQQGQMIIQDLHIKNFHFINPFGNAPNPLRKILNSLTSKVQSRIQNRIEGMSPKLKDRLNLVLESNRSDVKVGNTKVSIDAAFHIPKIQNDLIIAEGYFYAFNNQKPKIRPPFTNRIPFPIEDINSEITLYISEYSLNSMFYAFQESGELNKTIDAKKFKKISEFISLDPMFPDVDQKVQRSEDLTANIVSISMPVAQITPQGIIVRVNAIITLNSNDNGKEELIIKVRTTLSFELMAQLVNENKAIKLNIVKYEFESMENVQHKKNELDTLIMVLNNFIPIMLENQPTLLELIIPIENQYFQLTNPHIELMNNHIKVQGDPVFL